RLALPASPVRVSSVLTVASPADEWLHLEAVCGERTGQYARSRNRASPVGRRRCYWWSKLSNSAADSACGLAAMLFGYLRLDRAKVTPASSTIMDRMITLPTVDAV